MRLFTHSTIKAFIATRAGAVDHAAVRKALESWEREVLAAAWATPQQVKDQYANASLVGADRVVFNIKGNSYRLVVAIDYGRQAVFAKWFGTHAAYDAIDVATVAYVRPDEGGPD